MQKSLFFLLLFCPPDTACRCSCKKLNYAPLPLLSRTFCRKAVYICMIYRASCSTLEKAMNPEIRMPLWLVRFLSLPRYLTVLSVTAGRYLRLEPMGGRSCYWHTTPVLKTIRTHSHRSLCGLSFDWSGCTRFDITRHFDFRSRFSCFLIGFIDRLNCLGGLAESDPESSRDLLVSLRTSDGRVHRHRCHRVDSPFSCHSRAFSHPPTHLNNNIYSFESFYLDFVDFVFIEHWLVSTSGEIILFILQFESSRSIGRS